MHPVICVALHHVVTSALQSSQETGDGRQMLCSLISELEGDASSSFIQQAKLEFQESDNGSHVKHFKSSVFSQLAWNETNFVMRELDSIGGSMSTHAFRDLRDKWHASSVESGVGQDGFVSPQMENISRFVRNLSNLSSGVFGRPRLQKHHDRHTAVSYSGGPQSSGQAQNQTHTLSVPPPALKTLMASGDVVALWLTENKKKFSCLVSDLLVGGYGSVAVPIALALFLLLCVVVIMTGGILHHLRVNEESGDQSPLIARSHMHPIFRVHPTSPLQRVSIPPSPKPVQAYKDSMRLSLGLLPTAPVLSPKASTFPFLCIELVVPETKECVLKFPLLTRELLNGTQSFHVQDAKNYDILRVTLDCPAKGVSQLSNGGAVAEQQNMQLNIHSMEGTSLAHSEIMKVGVSTSEYFSVLHCPSGSTFGKIYKDVKGYTFSLSPAFGSQKVFFQPGDLSGCINIMDESSNVLAVADVAQGMPSERKVRIGPMVDAGFIILCLFGIDVLDM